VAVLIWAMIFQMTVSIDFAAVGRVGERPRGLIITLVVNWGRSSRSPWPASRRCFLSRCG
jgi:hypothetical protein